MALYGIYEISKLLTEPRRLEATLAKVLHLLSSFLDMRHGLIALLDERGEPEIVVGPTWSEATAKAYFEHLPEQAIGRIVVTQMPLVVADMKEEPLFEAFASYATEGAEGEISFIGVPIKDRGRVIGTLTIDRERRCHPYASMDEDVRFLSMVANLVGQTIRLQRLIATDRERLMEGQRRLEKFIEHGQPDRSAEFQGIVGDSPALSAVLAKVQIVARSHSTVLLRGESGTGKELFARAVHALSPRRESPYVAVNCAALPEGVLESELFGHEKGAFTGAAAMRRGRFELADGGTLFLDEIGEISPVFQAKLLRVLQEGEFERVGGTTTLKTNFRLVAATNRNLEEAVINGEFRADLYYRINVVPIFLPPLRSRPEDIPILAAEFLQRFNAEHGASLHFSDDAIAVLASCTFPGNVRELENCVRRTATLARGPLIGADDFACQHDECLSALLWNPPTKAAAPGQVSLPVVPRGPHAGSRREPADDHEQTTPPPEQPDSPGCPPPGACARAPCARDKGERERLIEAMDAAGWVQAKAARLLGLTPRQIGYALRRYDISIKKF
jgi:Nif-specific regulatory protein